MSKSVILFCVAVNILCAFGRPQDQLLSQLKVIKPQEVQQPTQVAYIPGGTVTSGVSNGGFVSDSSNSVSQSSSSKSESHQSSSKQESSQSSSQNNGFVGYQPTQQLHINQQPQLQYQPSHQQIAVQLDTKGNPLQYIINIPSQLWQSIISHGSLPNAQSSVVVPQQTATVSAGSQQAAVVSDNSNSQSSSSNTQSHSSQNTQQSSSRNTNSAGFVNGVQLGNGLVANNANSQSQLSSSTSESKQASQSSSSHSSQQSSNTVNQKQYAVQQPQLTVPQTQFVVQQPQVQVQPTQQPAIVQVDAKGNPLQYFLSIPSQLWQTYFQHNGAVAQPSVVSVVSQQPSVLPAVPSVVPSVPSVVPAVPSVVPAVPQQPTVVPVTLQQPSVVPVLPQQPSVVPVVPQQTAVVSDNSVLHSTSTTSDSHESSSNQESHSKNYLNAGVVAVDQPKLHVIQQTLPQIAVPQIHVQPSAQQTIQIVDSRGNPIQNFLNQPYLNQLLQTIIGQGANQPSVIAIVPGQSTAGVASGVVTNSASGSDSSSSSSSLSSATSTSNTDSSFGTHFGDRITQHQITPQDNYQAQNAHYYFYSIVDDNINGNFQQREEQRNGLKTTGYYAYDDGNIVKSVLYEADQTGYHVLKETLGPSVKAKAARTGVVTVITNINGKQTQYSYTKNGVVHSNQVGISPRPQLFLQHV